MLQISESPDTLFDQMASALAQTRDPRARHWLIFPQQARSSFVTQAWARKSGIASHSQTVELRTLLEQVAAGSKPRFQFESLKLAIAMALPAVQAHPGCFLPETAVLTPITPAVLEWAGSLANAMDDTLLSRKPGSRWDPGSFLDALSKQPAVAQMLSLHIGNVSPEDFDRGLDAWTADWTGRGGLPHLWIQLDAGLPQTEFDLFIRLYTQLAASHPDRIHLYVLSPTDEFWADACTRARNRRGGLLDLHSDELSPGGVLWAFGRNAQALHRQLAGTLLAEGDGGRFVHAPLPKNTLLGTLQLSCRTAAPFSPEQRVRSTREDRTFTIHSCRNTLRELENCRDRILQALEEEPGLRPEEIVVLLANPEEQAPLVEAAFRPDICPFRLLGFGKTVPSPLSTGIELLFEAVRGRVTLEQVRALLEHPLVAARFGSGTGEALEALGWLQDARFLWGLDAAHRLQFQAIEESRWNLFWAIQRLGLGAILPPDALGVPVHLPGSLHPMVPLERATGLNLKHLAAFTLFATRLGEARLVWSTDTARPLTEWLTRISDLVQNLFDLKKAGVDPVPFEQVVLGPLRQTAGTFDPRLTPSAFLRLLQQRLDLLGQDAIRGPGGIWIADLRHYAGIPARMILVAGLNEDTFPAKDDRPEWHPLARHPKTGDPSRRDADRHAFLLALLAARERLVLSFLGGSDTDTKTRPPSTALADLLQILDADILDASEHGAVSFSHLLNGFSRQNSQLPADQRSYLASDHRAAALLESRPGFLPLPGLWSLRIAPSQTDVTLRDLEMLLKEPATLFLRRLGIRLPEEAEVQPPGDLLDLDGLAVWKIRDALLPVRLEGGDEVKALESLAHAGHIPRGQLGRELEHGWSEKLPAPPVPVLSPSQRFQPALRVLAEPSRLVSGQAQYLWYLVSDPEPVLRHYSVSSDSIEKRLPLFLEALCMAANEPTTTKVPARGQLYFQGAKPIDFAIPDSVSAKALLQQLLPLYDLAQSRPLPFWPGSAQMLLALKSEAPDTHPPVADLLEHYREKWEADGSFGVSGEIQKPHTRFAFRGCPNPFVLMAPESEAAFLPDPAHPLSWRLVQFIRNWCLTAGLPLTKSHV